MANRDFLNLPPQEIRGLIDEALKKGDETTLERCYTLLDVAFTNLLFDISMDRHEVDGVDDPPNWLLCMEQIKRQKLPLLRMQYYKSLATQFRRNEPEKAIASIELGRSIALSLYKEEQHDEEHWMWLCEFNQMLFLLSEDRVTYAKALHDLYVRISDDLDASRLSEIMHFCFDEAVKTAPKDLLIPLQKQVLNEIEEIYTDNPEAIFEIVLSFGIHKRDSLQLPSDNCQAWLDIAMKAQRTSEPKVLNSLGHTYQRAGESFRRADYIHFAVSCFEQLQVKNPMAWHNYVYLGKCHTTLAQMEPQNVQRHLARAVFVYKDGLSVDNGISLLNAASETFFKAIESGEQNLGVDLADLEVLLKEAELKGEGFYWFAYRGLFKLYLLLKQEAQALAWLLRGWLLLDTYIPKEEIRTLMQNQTALNDQTQGVMKQMIHHQPEINWKPIDNVVGLRTRALPDLMALFEERIEHHRSF